MRNSDFIPAQTLSFATVEEDRKRLLTYSQSLGAQTELKLNLSAVLHCDSAGLALLIEAKRQAEKQGKILNITGASKGLHALAAFCGVNELLGLNQTTEPVALEPAPAS